MTTARRLFCLSLEVLLLLNTGTLSAGVEISVPAVQEHFEKEGFVLLQDFLDINGKGLLAEWKNFSDEFFDDIFRQLYENGHTQFPSHIGILESGKKVYAMGEGRTRGFQEIVMRNPGRYEISLMNEAVVAGGREQRGNNKRIRPTVDPLLERLSPIVSKLLHSKMDEINLYYSLIVSTPLATEQKWHADGEHVDLDQHLPCHCLSVFIPLVNVTSNMGPTEILPASHFHTRQPSPMKIDPGTLKAPVAPTLNLGDVLIFDYRVLHRGRPNLSSDKDRPYLNLILSQPWFKDVKNWPNRTLTVRTDCAAGGPTCPTSG